MEYNWIMRLPVQEAGESKIHGREPKNGSVAPALHIIGAHFMGWPYLCFSDEHMHLIHYSYITLNSCLLAVP